MDKFNMNNSDKKEFLNKWESQVRKGVLDFIILLYLQKKEYYGYELITAIKDSTEMVISEGTIYPLLNRMKKQGLVSSQWIEMETGIPRKYYKITDIGKIMLDEMKNSWIKINFNLQKLMVR